MIAERLREKPQDVRRLCNEALQTAYAVTELRGVIHKIRTWSKLGGDR